MKRCFNNVINITLCLLMISCLFGCSNTSTNQVQEQQEETINEQDSNNNVEPVIDEIPIEPVEDEEENIEELKLTDIQLNSIAMLNYLTYTTEKIRQSKNSRLYLEEVYSELINGTYPNAINEKTQSYMKKLLNMIEDFRIVEIKRDRLNYIYEQNKANNIMSALPSPMSILNVVQSGNPLKLVASLTYMAVDSATSYATASSNTDLEYLKGEWELDDKDSETINSLRIETFGYRNEVVNENNIDGALAINENSTEYLVQLENMSNVSRRIELLENNVDTYKAFGNYWIILAKSYYENENYQKCVEATDKYLEVQPRIFLYDGQLASVLPLAISSAKEIYSGDELINKELNYLDLLAKNTNSADTKHSDWSLKYFAAIAYIDLYKETNNASYLTKAYTEVKNNVYNLIDEQTTQNEKYLAEVKEMETPKDATKDEKESIKEYNKSVKEQREKELPPVSNSLITNLKLMFELANKLQISETERKEIDKSLHENGNNLILVDLIDNCYWFSKNNKLEKVDIFEGSKITIPANYVCDNSKIVLEVNGNTVIDDWQLEKVNRKGETVDTFEVVYSSKQIKKVDFKEGDVVTIKIYPYDEYIDVYKIKYNVVNDKVLWVINNIKFNLTED